MKKWTKEECDYLSNSWGTVSIPNIAKNLGRSVDSVRNKAYKMKLGAFLDASDFITYNQLLIALGINSGNTYKAISWINKRKLPVKTKRVNQNKFLVIKIDDFWKWAELNTDIIDFSRLPKNLLGKEPKWVDNARKISEYTVNNCNPKGKWSNYEDERLVFLLKRHKYTCSEIAKDLRRTEGAVLRRITELKIKERPLKQENRNWTDEEIQNVKKYIADGYTYEIISEKIGRSSKCIRGITYRLYKTENLQKIREYIRTKQEICI